MNAPMSGWTKLAAAVVVTALGASAAWADNELTMVGTNNRSPDGMYGNCARIASGYANGLNSKRDVANVAGRDVSKAEAIDVIQCGIYDGGGGTNEVPCPVSGYTYCAQNHNDGAGNSIMVGVVLDTTGPVCKVVARRDGPWGQIDVLVRDGGSGLGTGIRNIEFRAGVTNAVLSEYETLDRAGIIVITATKEDRSRPAEIKSFFATDGAQNTVSCGPYSF